MPRGVGAAVAAAFALLVLAAPAGAATNAKYGIQDDAWLAFGPGSVATRVATLKGLGAGLVRFTLRWDQIAPTKPVDAADPEDPAYRWGLYGRVLDELHTRGIPALVTIYGSPRWANGGGGPNVLPGSGVADFASAAAARFPWVHLWTAWNEPNTKVFSNPVSPALYVRNVLNPAYRALHAASGANRVAGGVTSPRQTPTGMAPLDYMRGMRAAGAKLDAYAQNPYAVSPFETPFEGRCSTCFTMADLAGIRREVTRIFGAKQLWLTEYGYQTNPPDPLSGVSYAKQAQYLGEAAMKVWHQPGATLLVQFLVRDEPAVGGWQSGLVDVNGRQKPSYDAFALPLAQSGRTGSAAVLWGQVRPGAGARTYRIERAVGSSWRAVGGLRRTARNGTLAVRLALPSGSRVRIVAPSFRRTSPPLTLR